MADMNVRALQQEIHVPLDDNQRRGIPRLPGTSMPAIGELPLVYIYRPAPSATQGGAARSQDWVLEFSRWAAAEIEPLMGWAGSRDPLASALRLRFPNRESAIAFAEQQGWTYLVRDPPMRRFRPKSYADNFKYELSDALLRAQRRWGDTVSITDRSQPRAPASIAR